MTLLYMLKVTASDEPFLPKLRHLSINLSKHLEMRYFPYLQHQDTLVSALQSRWNVESGSVIRQAYAKHVRLNFGNMWQKIGFAYDNSSKTKSSGIRELDKVIKQKYHNGLYIEAYNQQLPIHGRRDSRPTSWLKRLRTTNEPPSEDEADYVHNTVLRAIQDDTDNVDARLAELQSAANALVQERNQLVRYANSFKSLLYPIRRLPPELLMEIFQHACAHTSRDDSFYHTSSRWAIPHVCRNGVASHYPARPFWSSIYAFLRRTSPAIPALDAMLHRSGTRPLTVRLVTLTYSDDLNVLDFFGRIRAQSWRWRSLEIDYSAALATAETNIHVEIYLPSPLSEFQKTGFSQYPNLRTLVLRHTSIMELDLPWPQITTLIITEAFRGDLMSYIRALRSVRLCRYFRSISLLISDDLPAIRGQSFMVPLLALKRLDLAVGHVINHLILPQLEEVRLGVDHPADYDIERHYWLAL
ncbi:hypothetical protein BDZ89DRAFT_1122371 [Hymenopellis radicata]|nr:hypothetical protein BDZ89DRAFT_1122371 [Hymenopellis radicata]